MSSTNTNNNNNKPTIINRIDIRNEISCSKKYVNDLRSFPNNETIDQLKRKNGLNSNEKKYLENLIKENKNLVEKNKNLENELDDTKKECIRLFKALKQCNDVMNDQCKFSNKVCEYIFDKCAICLDHLIDNIATINCGHKYHNGCIDKYLYRSQKDIESCPQCRSDITSITTNNETIKINNNLNEIPVVNNNNNNNNNNIHDPDNYTYNPTSPSYSPTDYQ